jgi:hypothetical protein
MIARRLGISVHTAKFHVRSLLDKLDAVGRTDAVAHAARLGVIMVSFMRNGKRERASLRAAERGR